jgi:hypothetical protein
MKIHSVITVLKGNDTSFDIMILIVFLCPCLFITFLRSDQGQSIARQNFDKYIKWCNISTITFVYLKSHGKWNYKIIRKERYFDQIKSSCIYNVGYKSKALQVKTLTSIV